MVNAPKTIRTFCKAPKCRKHETFKITQYKAGKASLVAQGAPQPHRAAAARCMLGGRSSRLAAETQQPQRGATMVVIEPRPSWQLRSHTAASAAGTAADAIQQSPSLLAFRAAVPGGPSLPVRLRQVSGGTTASRLASVARPSPCSTRRCVLRTRRSLRPPPLLLLLQLLPPLLLLLLLLATARLLTPRTRLWLML
tara:strand:- start:40 stop:627 length:588 start_codon:yes stop_codon:yes gene_type:complete